MGQSYKDLLAWERAIELVTDIYRATGTFPRNEMHGLTSQLRRAAISIPSNIAEGQARFSPREFHHFLSQARGSLAELETQVFISAQLGYLPEDLAGRLMKQAASARTNPESFACVDPRGSNSQQKRHARRRDRILIFAKH